MQRLLYPSVRPGSEPSWWLQEALAFEGNPPPLASLEEKLDVDVAIVGGGYTGLWTALSLRERAPNLRIALVEANVCGAGASGKSGGLVHGYWHGMAKYSQRFGDAIALEIAHMGSRAQDAIRAFCTAPGVDVWWHENGIVKIACSPAQDVFVEQTIAAAKRLGAVDKAVPLTPEEVQQRCISPVFRAGVWLTEAGTVQPARLVRALRRAALQRGIQIYENTPVDNVRVGPPHVVLTPHGKLRAPDVVLALNARLTSRPDLQPHMMNFSSFMVLTEPVPERLQEIGWTGREGLDDARMFLHYFRTTEDGRVAMGSGSGPIDFNGSLAWTNNSPDAAARAETGLRRLLPGLGNVAVTHAWGGAIDVSADGVPFFGTLKPGGLHYGCGYSGHGVNPSWIGGNILASLVLRQDDEWTRSFFCRRRVPMIFPEPFRTVVARLVRSAIIRCEEADEDEEPAPLLARAGAALPKIFGIRLGTR
ncbi:MAG: NAD(P)/FAD-dependent oxidoreductase [Vulcanimicrobiaceae bacterium]